MIECINKKPTTDRHNAKRSHCFSLRWGTKQEFSPSEITVSRLYTEFLRLKQPNFGSAKDVNKHFTKDIKMPTLTQAMLNMTHYQGTQNKTSVHCTSTQMTTVINKTQNNLTIPNVGADMEHVKFLFDTCW
jgi:hypothetical protein